MSPQKQYMITDLNSSNGTYVNNIRIDKPTLILHKDSIKIGKYDLLFELVAGNKPIAEIPEFQEKTIMFPKDHPGLTSQTVKAAMSKPRLVVTEGGAEPKALTIEKNMISLGGAKSSDIVLPGLFTARTQAVITYQNGDYYISNVGKEDGTLVNAEIIGKNYKLTPKDVITIGKVQIIFR